MTPKFSLARNSRAHFVQTQRETHEAWSRLIRKSAIAGAIMHELAARVGEQNAVVISHGALAKLVDCHRNSVIKAIRLLEEGCWLRVARIGERGTTCAYVINAEVAWTQPRDNLKFSLFTATVIVDAAEQPEDMNRHGPLRPLPRIGERQIPTGPGEPPPSQPFLDGMEPDLPATAEESYDPETGEMIDIEDMIRMTGRQLRAVDDVDGLDGEETV